jgi:predicted O-methyltransferase YrrM
VTKGCRAMIKGLKHYIQEITTNPIYETQIYKEIGDGVGITKIKHD